MISASGELTFNTLKYSIFYEIKNVTFETHMQILYSVASVKIPGPAIEEYLPIANIYAPLALEKAYGLLSQSTHVTSQLTQTIFSQANSLQYESLLTMSRTAQTGSIETQITLYDTSRGNEKSTKSQTETFDNGSYWIQADHNTPSTQSMDHADFFSYYSQTLTKNILASGYITQANAERKDGCIYLSINANDQLAQKLCQSICQTLYQDPSFLDYRSAAHDDYFLIYSITLDPTTGLPLTCDLDFSGKHTIEQIDYTLTAQYRQTYSYN